MGVVVDFFPDWIWDGIIMAAYGRHGIWGAAAALLVPFLMMALIIVFVMTL